MARDKSEIIRKLRQEVIRLEREVGEHCKTIMKMEEELRRYRKG